MGKKKREAMSPPALGGSSLLVVFAVLALTVFALLSLSTVRADVRLGDTAAQAVADYYTADVQAQELLARIRSGELPDGVEMEVSTFEYPERVVRTYTYAVPMSDTQELQVQVQIDEDGWQVLRWCSAPVGEWEADTSLDLWDGELVFEW